MKHKDNEIFYNASCYFLFMLLLVALVAVGMFQAGEWFHNHTGYFFSTPKNLQP